MLDPASAVGKENYAPLDGPRCGHVGYLRTTIYMKFESLKGDVEFRFVLNFGAERIQNRFRQSRAADPAMLWPPLGQSAHVARDR